MVLGQQSIFCSTIKRLQIYPLSENNVVFTSEVNKKRAVGFSTIKTYWERTNWKRKPTLKNPIRS